MKDIVLDYMKKKGIPATRENYVALDTLGDQDGKGVLPAEQEADLPEELQLEQENVNGKNSE